MEMFSTGWKAWYMSLQPQSRVGQKAWPPLKNALVDSTEWDGLRKGLRKGFVLLLISLSWWEAQVTMKKQQSMMVSALQDVLLVMQQLAVHDSSDDTLLLHKHARGPQKSGLPPTKRCAYPLFISSFYQHPPGKGFSYDNIL